jgi:hypothetical protein
LRLLSVVVHKPNGRAVGTAIGTHRMTCRSIFAAYTKFQA